MTNSPAKTISEPQEGVAFLVECLYICFWSCRPTKTLILQLSIEPILNILLVFIHPLNICLCPFNDLLQSSSCEHLFILILLPLELLHLCKDNFECLCKNNGGNAITDWDIINYYSLSSLCNNWKSQRVTKNGKQRTSSSSTSLENLFVTPSSRLPRDMIPTPYLPKKDDCQSHVPYTYGFQQVTEIKPWSHMSIFLCFQQVTEIQLLRQWRLSFIYSWRQPLDPELLLIFDTFM